MSQNKDFRKNFLNNILINDDVENEIGGQYQVTKDIKELNDALNIEKFKVHFNNMIIGLGHLKITLYDILKFYAIGISGDEIYESQDGGENKKWDSNRYLASEWEQKTITIPNVNNKVAHKNVLSNFIMDMIIEVIDNRFASESIDNYNDNTDKYTASIYMMGTNSNPYYNSKNFIKYFKEQIQNNRGENIGTIINKFNVPEYVKILKHLNQDIKIFELYDYIVNIENKIEYTHDKLNRSSTKIVYFIQNYLVIYILKYFLLSELLLRTLLDTKTNTNMNTNPNQINKVQYINSSDGSKKDNPDVDDTIYNEENIINNNYNNYGNNYIISFNQNDIGMKLRDGEIVENNSDVKDIAEYVYKIIKDMWLINNVIDKNATFLSTKNIAYINTQDNNPNIQSKTDVENLNNKVDNINKNINELNLKNLNLQKNYEKKRNMYYIIITLIVIFIFLNVYVIKNNNLESLLTINGIIVVVILLTKFFTLIKKSYQTLVRDLNN